MRYFRDLSGKKIGFLKVIERVFTKNRAVVYRCICDCGKEVIVKYSNLLYNSGIENRSCGCYTRRRPIKDIAGIKFGRLIAIRFTGKTNKSHNALWECKCDCGSTVIVATSDLLRGHGKGREGTKSCGCLRKEAHRKYEYGVSSFNSMYNKLKFSSRKRKLNFSLSKSEVKKISKQNCFYCGDIPKNRCTGRGYYGEYIYNGLDRIDSSKGYSIDNVVPCCKTCNLAKRDMTVNEFSEWIKRVYNSFVDKNKGYIK